MNSVEQIDNQILLLKKKILDLRNKRSEAKALEAKRNAYYKKLEADKKKKAADIVRRRQQQKKCDSKYPKAHFDMTNGF